MQLTLHATRQTPHGASRFLLAMSACSVKTRCAPSRHYRDARVYGHTTTAMNDNEYTRPDPPIQRTTTCIITCTIACYKIPQPEDQSDAEDGTPHSPLQVWEGARELRSMCGIGWRRPKRPQPPTPTGGVTITVAVRGVRR